jgi:glucose-1-phosphate adenylyltransferase
MDLLDEKRKLEIDDPNWAILTRTAPRVPALIYDSANITESLIAHGAKIYGAVKNCVLSAGVVVEEGAEIEECVVFADSTIKKGVKLKRAIVDEETVVTAKKIQEVTKNQKKEILVVGQKTVKTSAEIKSDAEKKK